MTNEIRLSPVLLDGAIAYLASGDAEALALLVGYLPAALDTCMRRSAAGLPSSCHVWGAHTSITAEELHDLVIEGANGAGCDLVFTAEPVVQAVPCACATRCAASGELCAGCLNAPPTERVEDKDYCADCAGALREAMGVADTLPPGAPGDLDASILRVLPGPVEDDGAPSFLPAMREGLRS